jgi:hypothetical protein
MGKYIVLIILFAYYGMGESPATGGQFETLL